ncbi:MAG: phosphoribosylamine--glycine ligase [Deltaproteobacteria bacterium]|nr:phosphoribosylamine--glycine ligase [Deltaproteobacteria bacterium]
MRILVIGGGGREHALIWKLAQSPRTEAIYCAPGNAGIASLAACVPIAVNDIQALKKFAREKTIDLTVVGPEEPLTLGIVDEFEAAGLRIFGPSRDGARMEGSKAFAKNIMLKAGVPTAAFRQFTDYAEACAYVSGANRPLVIKADGLAAGKGVFVCRTMEQAREALERVMANREFGEAGQSVVIEDCLSGEEASFICLTDGTTVVPLPSSQDHKAVFDNDEGPNTGGMGAYSPAPVVTPRMHALVMQTVMQPVVDTLRESGIRFKGILYAGLMIEGGVPNVLEFNVRMGDPETQPIVFRLQSDLIELIEAVIDERLHEITVAVDPQPAVCVVMAAGGYPGTYEKGLPITGLDRAADLEDTMVFHAGTRQQGPDVLTNGGRVLGVTARGASIAAAIDTAYRAVRCIAWPGVQFRNDIGRKALNR